MSSIKGATYYILSNDNGVSAIVGTGIYPSAAPSTATCPFITYSVISELTDKVTTGATGTTRYRLQFSCYSFDSITNTSLVQALKDCLDVKTYTHGGFQASFFEDASMDTTQAPTDASEQFSYQTNVDYVVWFRNL